MQRIFTLLSLGLLIPALWPAGSPAAAAEVPAQQYAAIRAQWDQLNGQVDALGDQFRTATPAKREELRKQYIALVGQINELFPKLREAAIAAYKAAPNADEELMRLLIGITASDLRTDQYDAAAQLSGLLIGNNCPEKAIYGLAGSAAYCLDDFATAEKYLTTAREAELLDRDGQVYATDVNLAKQLWAKEQQLRQAEAAAGNLPRVLMKTTKGEMVIELYENEAPQTVGNFVSLVEKGFYNGLTFHRVLPGFMAQGGCPDGTGGGGPGYDIYCECEKPEHRNHFRGTLSMAHAGKNTGGSQFFLTFRRTSHLDGMHTVFGRVVEGLEVLEKLQRIDPQRPSGAEPDKIVEAKVVRKRDHKYEPTKVQ